MCSFAYDMMKTKSIMSKNINHFKQNFSNLILHFYTPLVFLFIFILNEWIQFVHTPPTTSLVPPLLL